MRVGLVQLHLEPEWGGAWTFQQTLGRTIRELEPETKHRFQFYDLRRTHGTILREGADRLLRHVQDEVLGVPRKLARTSALERRLDADGIDLVWFTTQFALEVNRPYIFTVWDVEHLRAPWFPELSNGGEWGRRQRFFNRFIGQATRIIVPNNVGLEQLVRHFGVEPERILCLTHPTPDFALRAAEAAPLACTSVPRPYLLYPAQFWPHKDHATLLDAMTLLPEYHLALVGSDKGQLDRVRKHCQHLGLNDRVHFLGFVETETLVSLYQHAHALAYTSLLGPENLPPLEACALNCPAIVADVPGAAEQLGDAVLRVSLQNKTALASAVRALEEPAVRNRQQIAGRERVTRGTARDYVREVLAFLDEFEPILGCWK
jgi:glycosyltransferase involved in cell wall biosynthesis